MVINKLTNNGDHLDTCSLWRSRCRGVATVCVYQSFLLTLALISLNIVVEKSLIRSMKMVLLRLGPKVLVLINVVKHVAQAFILEIWP